MPYQQYIDYRKFSGRLKADLVEVGFGNAQFLVEIAKQNPDKIVLGFEVSDASIRKLVRKLRNNYIPNLFFVKIDAFWGFQLLVEDNSVEKLYINYPCPWFKKRHHRRRITRREALLLFAKKIKSEGQIIIRTDYYDLVEYTAQQAEGIFEVRSSQIHVDQPITKYEKKWLEEGRKIYEIVLTKKQSKDPDSQTNEIKFLEISYRDTAMVIPKKMSLDQILNYLRSIREEEIRLKDQVVAKFLDSYFDERKIVVETLISEKGFVQKFFLLIEDIEEKYLIDVSEFSEILRTDGILRFVRYISDVLSKEDDR
ncbi:MAG: tRNA (guanosine(46)-N7)-methyltransferase TrmB [Candidatus Calescibacterium sp.]|nr:tRNA (guanosine(46)-N7)-methyltransferase TrmB [Candidatus Calescibacterium sp.]